MTTGDVIPLINILLSFGIALVGIIIPSCICIVSIVVAVKTLKQNSKMIEESTRPIIEIYTAIVNFNGLQQYIVIKNFGRSSAVITSFKPNRKMQQYIDHSPSREPFEHIINATIAPNQRLIAVIDNSTINSDNAFLSIDIRYNSASKRYAETKILRLDIYNDLLQSRANTPNAELEIISHALQEIAERML